QDRKTADTLAALPRFWVHSLGRQRTTDERTTSRPNTQPGLPSNNHLWKLPRSRPSPRRCAARWRCAGTDRIDQPSKTTATSTSTYQYLFVVQMTGWPDPMGPRTTPTRSAAARAVS